MKKIHGLILTLICPIIFACSTTAQTSTVYTDLSGDNCRTVKSNEETGSTEKRCGAFGNWSLMVLDDDDRMSVNIITPDQKQHELNFWGVVTPAFSSLGSKAEWRVIKANGISKPFALIVRIDSTSEQNGKRERQSYLAVSKITETEICVVEKISEQKNANQLARDAAENAAAKPCLKEQ